jgi:hypothetical protein
MDGIGFRLTVLQADIQKDVAGLLENLSNILEPDMKISAVCNMAIHYFLKNDKTVDNLTQILDKINGTFLFTGLSGKHVYSQLGEEGFIDFRNKTDRIAYIERLYKPDEKFKNLGQPILVYIKSIGFAKEEYLINTKFLGELLQKHEFRFVKENLLINEFSERMKPSSYTIGDYKYARNLFYSVYMK